jgi:hypothetical protein
VTTQAQLDMNFLACVREDIADGHRGKFYTVEFVVDIMAAVDRVIAERDEARREVCEAAERDAGVTAERQAEIRGWDCFKEDGK